MRLVISNRYEGRRRRDACPFSTHFAIVAHWSFKMKDRRVQLPQFALPQPQTVLPQSSDASGTGGAMETMLATVADIARMTRMSTRTLWRLVSAEEMPEPLRIGRSVRWRLDEIKEWISAGCPSRQKNTERRRQQ